MTTGRGGAASDFDQAEILFGGEALQGFGRKGGSGDGFDEELGDLFGCCGVDFAIDADDSAEGGDGIAGQRLLVGLEDRCAGGRAAGIGVLDDGHHGLIEFPGQLPAGVEIDEIVEAELLALQLCCAGDAEAGAVGIERGALVGIFAVAQGLGERKVDAEGRPARASASGAAGDSGAGASGDAFERVGDGGVVGGGEREGLPGETPAGCAAEGCRRLALQLFDQGRVVRRRG